MSRLLLRPRLHRGLLGSAVMVLLMGVLTMAASANGTLWYQDADGDTYGNPDVSISDVAPPEGYVGDYRDCDDTDATINPAATEIWYDGIDQDCGYNNDFDQDGDSYVRAGDAAHAGGTAPFTDDCLDYNPTINPGEDDIPDNGIDENCNGYDADSWVIDADDDNYGNQAGHIVHYDGPLPDPPNLADNLDDCNDGDATINPGADEVVGDGVDQDCSGTETWYVDADEDGYRPDEVSTAEGPLGGPGAGQTGTATPIGDCNDTNAAINPGAVDIPDNGIDENCNGGDAHVDSDGDGIGDVTDNCPLIRNPTQRDRDRDGLGNPCDPDRDGDTFLNGSDNCPSRSNKTQADRDRDGVGNACDPDIDGDAVPNDSDNCPFRRNKTQRDRDRDGIGNPCDPDLDGDLILNGADNCPSRRNVSQRDRDDDGIGNRCDADIDGDGFLNKDDAYPANPRRH